MWEPKLAIMLILSIFVRLWKTWIFIALWMFYQSSLIHGCLLNTVLLNCRFNTSKLLQIIESQIAVILAHFSLFFAWHILGTVRTNILAFFPQCVCLSSSCWLCMMIFTMLDITLDVRLVGTDHVCVPRVFVSNRFRQKYVSETEKTGYRTSSKEWKQNRVRVTGNGSRIRYST